MDPALSTNLHLTVTQPVAGWTTVYARLARLHARWNKPIMFTEIGVRSIVRAAQAPWDWQASGRVDLVVQRRWYQAALRTFAARKWMKGLFFWQWSPYPSTTSASERSYSPYGKPADAVLCSWFTHKLR